MPVNSAVTSWWRSRAIRLATRVTSRSPVAPAADRYTELPALRRCAVPVNFDTNAAAGLCGMGASVLALRGTELCSLRSLSSR